MSNGRAIRRRTRPISTRGNQPLRAESVRHDDPTVAYGARCTWWDDKNRAAAKPSGLPCCPHCGGVLFENEMTTWWKDAHRYEADGHPGYVPFLRWLQGKCFPTFDAAQAAYKATESRP